MIERFIRFETEGTGLRERRQDEPVHLRDHPDLCLCVRCGCTDATMIWTDNELSYDDHPNRCIGAQP